MKGATVIFGPDVDMAIQDMVEHVGIDDIPTVINFLDRIQTRLVPTLSTSPEGGSGFQGRVRQFVVDRYVFLFEYHENTNEVHVLDMIAPGRNWK